MPSYMRRIPPAAKTMYERVAPPSSAASWSNTRWIWQGVRGVTISWSHTRWIWQRGMTFGVNDNGYFE